MNRLMTPRLEEAFKDFLLYFQDGKGTRMKDVNKEFLLGFIDFLRNDYRTPQGKPIASYTQRSYFGIFNSALNAAVQADVIPDNPVNR